MTRTLGLVAVVAMAGLLVTALACDASQVAADDRRGAREVAGAFTAALLSYDHRDLDSDLDAVAALATDDFATRYRARFVEDVQSTMTDTGAVATTEAREVFLDQVDGDEVVAVVHAVGTVESSAGTRRIVTYVRLELVRQPAGWRVADAQGISSTET